MTGRRSIAALLAVFALGGLPASTALGNANSVPTSLMAQRQAAITANTLKPTSCSAITVTTVVAGVTGTAGNDLLLGTAGDSMSAGGGNDCVLGGGGNDSISCGTGTDVAIGGPGTDTFNGNCETQIQ